MTATKPQKFDVTICHNGVPKTIEVNPQQQLQAVLQHALNTFEIRQGRENLVLATEDGSVLDPGQSASAAGLGPGAKLFLQPRRAAGGT